MRARYISRKISSFNSYNYNFFDRLDALLTLSLVSIISCEIMYTFSFSAVIQRYKYIAEHYAPRVMYLGKKKVSSPRLEWSE